MMLFRNGVPSLGGSTGYPLRDRHCGVLQLLQQRFFEFLMRSLLFLSLLPIIQVDRMLVRMLVYSLMVGGGPAAGMIQATSLFTGELDSIACSNPSSQLCLFDCVIESRFCFLRLLCILHSVAANI